MQRSAATVRGAPTQTSGDAINTHTQHIQDTAATGHGREIREVVELCALVALWLVLVVTLAHQQPAPQAPAEHTVPAAAA